MTIDELGSALRARRKSLGLTQEETAAVADVSLRVLVDLEKGRPTVRLDIVGAVLDALGLEVDLKVRGT